ncbi:MAG TPA: hypothetical protein DCM71_24190 [Runella sp.]|nr:hypothetical protein [Runella sp.]
MKMLYVFTEEPSAKIVMDSLLPKVLPEGVGFKVFPHQGKQDLEKALRKTLPHISQMPGAKILVTRDQDSADCVALKKELNTITEGSCKCEYSIRIICKELEAWFLGDLKAVQAAYPRLKPEQHLAKADFKNVDKITNPNKYLLKIIPEYKNRETLPKLECSERISPFLDLENNRSESFNHTVTAIRKLIET